MSRLFSLLFLIALVAGNISVDKPAIAQTAAKFFLPAGAVEQGWPTVRGPSLDGHSNEIRLADQWPDSGPPILWTRQLGKGYSSMTASGDRVFTQYQTLGGQYVSCLDADSGETIWEHRYDWAYEATGLYPGPRSTPTIADRRVYFTSPDALVGCLDWDGDLLWSVDLKDRFGTRGTEFGYACSPIVWQDRVLLPLGGTDASMVALDAITGAVAWHSGDEPASYTPAMPIKVGDSVQVVGYLQHALCGFDFQTGKLLWKIKLSRGYDEHSAWPLYAEPHLWVSAPFQAGWQLFDLSPSTESATSTIHRVAQGDRMSNDVSSSVLVDGHVYGFDLTEAQSKAHRPSRGQFRCIDFLTGESRWENGSPKRRRSTDHTENRDQQIVGHASVIAADGKLILLNDLGDLILAKASPDRYTELGRVQVLGGEIGWATPALHRGRLYVRNQSRVVCLHLGRSDLIEQRDRERAIPMEELSLAYWDWTHLLGVEPEYAMDPPTRSWLANWFAAIAACFLVAAILTSTFKLFLRAGPFRTRFRAVFVCMAFLLCLFSGSAIGLAVNDFVFTWPGCLFVTFSSAVSHSKRSRRSSQEIPSQEGARPSRKDLTSALIFVACCLLYFFACRRLSLLTQWVFLCGFVAAVPMLLLCRSLAAKPGWKMRLAEGFSWSAAFAAFYWAGAVVLYWKYDIAA